MKFVCLTLLFNDGAFTFGICIGYRLYCHFAPPICILIGNIDFNVFFCDIFLVEACKMSKW